MLRSRTPTLVFAVSLVGAACAKTKPETKAVPLPATPSSTVETPALPVAPPSTPPSFPLNDPNSPSAIAERELAREAARTTLVATIYFDTNEHTLRDDARVTLDTKISLLRADPSILIFISGHCDERGEDEYNLSLGRRRAEAAKQYLVDHNISASRIRTKSQGSEQPAVPGTGEEVWSKNRRDEFEVFMSVPQRPITK